MGEKMDYKEETKSFYSKHAKKYEEFTKDYFEKYVPKELNLFLKSLKGKKILDLGCGPGRESLIFKERGFSPLCVDFSDEMIKLCREKGLKTEKMDIENLKFEKNSFDGVWAYTSLHHMPKIKIKKVLNKIAEILKEKGIFFIAVKLGDFEGMQDDPRYPGSQRYVSFYQDKEIREILMENFNILFHSKVYFDKDHAYLNYLCELKF